MDSRNLLSVCDGVPLFHQVEVALAIKALLNGNVKHELVQLLLQGL